MVAAESVVSAAVDVDTAGKVRLQGRAKAMFTLASPGRTWVVPQFRIIPLENSVHPVSGLPKAPPDTQRPDWQGHFRHIAKARKQLFALFPPAHTAHAFASGIG